MDVKWLRAVAKKALTHRGTGENRRGLRLIEQDSILGKVAATCVVRGRSSAGRGVSWEVPGLAELGDTVLLRLHERFLRRLAFGPLRFGDVGEP